MATDTLYIGGTLENGQITGYTLAFGPGDSSELSYVQSVSPDGNEMPVDELYVTLRCRKDSLTGGTPFLTVDGNAFREAGGQLLFVRDGPDMEDHVITGYVTFQTSGGETFLTSDGKTFLVPETQSLSDFWLSLFSGVSGGTPVWFLRENDDGSFRLEKYFWKSMVRVGKYDYDLTAQSPLGRLTSEFDGDLYTGQLLTEVLSDILSDIVPFSVDDALSGIRVYGWMPVRTRRESLHSLALAYGFIVRRNDNRDLFFTLPGTSPAELPDSILFNGGSVDYRMGGRYARVDVTESLYLQTDSDQEVILYDNTDGTSFAAENLRVVFEDAPAYDITPSAGLTVHHATANTAVVSGVGILTGKPYTVIQSTVSVDGDPRADPEHILSLTDAPLLTYLNSEIVAEKLRDSANAPAVVEMDFLRTTQAPGDLFRFVDPWGDERTGYLTGLDGKVTSLDRVTGSFLCGYVHHHGNAWDSVRLVSAKTTIPIGDDLDGQTLRVVLVSGGQGGASGQHGSDNAATGCSRGLPGNGGKIFAVKVPVRKGDTLTIAPGAGGAGGLASAETTDFPSDTMTVYVAPTGNRWHLNPNCGNGNYTPTTYALAVQRGLAPCENCVGTDKHYYISHPGAEGTPSTLTIGAQTYNSASGRTVATGYLDMISGLRYAIPGPDFGIDGGDATTAKENGNRENPAYTDITYDTLTLTGSQWGVLEGQSWTSGGVGRGNHSHTNADEHGDAFDEWAYGGLGGGPAVGNNGENGADVGTFADTGGRGGKGADASTLFPVNPFPFGSGGSGGHGGGQGGTGGSGNSTETTGMPANGARGAGGSGSDGQDGQPGCVLVYYKRR